MPNYRQIQQTWPIKVMPDFSSSGIWYFDPQEKGDTMIEPDEDLKISKELTAEFEQWIDYYETCFKLDYSTFKNKKMAEKMNVWGLALAKKLRKELPETEIWYWREMPKNKPVKKDWSNYIKKIKIK